MNVSLCTMFGDQLQLQHQLLTPFRNIGDDSGVCPNRVLDARTPVSKPEGFACQLLAFVFSCVRPVAFTDFK